MSFNLIKQSRICILLILLVDLYAITPPEISLARDSLATNPEFSNQIADKLLSENQLPEFELLTLKADVLAQLAENDSARVYYTQSFLAAHVLKDTALMLEAIDGESTMTFLMGKYDQTLALKLRYLALVEQRGGCENLADATKNVGSIHYYLENKETCLEWQYKAVAIAKDCGDERSYGRSLSNIGAIYNEWGQTDSAISYMNRSIASQIAYGKDKMLTTSHTILGNVYQSKLGQMDSALVYYTKALHYAELSKDPTDLAFIQINFGEYYNSLGDFSSALDYAQAAYNSYLKLNHNDGIIHARRSMAHAYLKLGVADSVYTILYEIMDWRNKTYSDSIAATTAQMQVQYETHKKELDNQKLRRIDALKTATIKGQKARQQLIIVTSLSFILFLLAVGWYLRMRILIRQKQHLSELDKQNFQAVMDAEDNERTRVARELHDGLGQLLSVAKLNVSGLEQGEDEQNNKMIRTAEGIIDEAVQEVRKISHNLMPGALVRLGLPEAIQDLVAKLNQAGVLQISFQYSGLETRLTNAIEINLFRITQEIISNAVKHSQANNVSIQIDKSENQLQFEYTDDGIGLDAVQLANVQGIGWKNIYSRVAMLDWKLDLTRGQNSGTLVKIEFEV